MCAIECWTRVVTSHFDPIILSMRSCLGWLHLQSPRETGFFAPIGYGVADTRYPWVMLVAAPSLLAPRLIYTARLAWSIACDGSTSPTALASARVRPSHATSPLPVCSRQCALRGGWTGGGVDLRLGHGGAPGPYRALWQGRLFIKGLALSALPSFLVPFLHGAGPCIGPPMCMAGVLYPARPVAILGLRSWIPPRWGLWPRLGIY